MRITDKLRYGQMQLNLQRAQGAIDKIQGMIASGKKVEKPSDDTVVYTRVTQIEAEKQVDTQLTRNLERIKTFSGMQESVLNDLNELLTQAKELSLEYANDTMDAASRKYGAQKVKDIIEHLVTLGNTRLANTYVFGGKKANQAPFELNPDYSVDYTVPYGAQETLDVYVDRGEREKSGVSGQELFFDKNKVFYEDPANSYRGDTFTNGSYYAFVIDAGNNTLYVDGSPVALDTGVYRGSELANQIQSKLGSGYYVTFDSATRRFGIENRTGHAATLNWSNGGATAATVLGFDRLDSTVDDGARDRSDVEAGSSSFLVKITQGGYTIGALQERARYKYSLDNGTTWSDEEMIVNYGRATASEFVVDSTNNTMYENGAPITLTAGAYTGATLATEIQTQLNAVQAGHTVTYDATTRKFTITNGTADTIHLNWSKPEATAASLLGFEAHDADLAVGASGAGDVEAGLSLNAIMEVGYQVSSTTNQLVVSDGTNDYTVTLNAGAYDGAGLAAEIQTQLNSTPLGAGLFAVSYDGATNQFTIQNTGGAAYTLKWSNGNSTAGTLLGFNASDSALASGASITSDFTTDPRNTIYKDGLPVTLSTGVYTAQGLAAEIQAKLGTGFRVSYDEGLRQFAIRNDTGVPVTFNWSNSSTTLGAMLGFDNRDSLVANGGSDVSDFDAGMLIDGTNGANSTNNRIKIFFGPEGSLAADDSFEIKDLNAFDFLKNLKDALEGNNTTGIRNAVRDIDLSLDVVRKNLTHIGMLTSKIDTLTEEKVNREYRYSQITASMVDADLAELTTEFTALTNSYQALLYSMAKMQDLSLMNYLK
jgi:flagellin-like hook-associated protein FlgL